MMDDEVTNLEQPGPSTVRSAITKPHQSTGWMDSLRELANDAITRVVPGIEAIERYPASREFPTGSHAFLEVKRNNEPCVLIVTAALIPKRISVHLR